MNINNILRSLMWDQKFTVKWNSTDTITVNGNLSQKITRSLIFVGPIKTGASVTTNVDWISINIDNTTVTFNISRNFTTTERTATITLTPPENYELVGKATITVVQRGDTTSYKLTVLKTDGGNVSVSPNKTSYSIGETVTLTASTNTNYLFAGYSSNSNETADSIGFSLNPSKTKTITITGNTTIKAVFRNFMYLRTKSKYNIRILKGDEIVDAGTCISEYTDENNYRVQIWKSKPLNNSAEDLRDNSLIYLSLKNSRYEPYMLEGADIVGDEMTITNDDLLNGWNLTAWNFLMGLGVKTIVTRDLAIIINWQDKTGRMINLSLSTSHTDSATLSGAGNYVYGSRVSIKCTPKSGYTFSYWDSSLVENPESASTTAVVIGSANNLNNSIRAQMNDENKYRLTLNVSPSSGGYTTGAGFYNSGDEVQIEAIPNSGYTFNRWSNSGSRVQTITMSSYDKTLTAYFDSISVSNPKLTLSSPQKNGGTDDVFVLAFPESTSGNIVKTSNSNVIGTGDDNLGTSSNYYNYPAGTRISLITGTLNGNGKTKFVRWSDGNTSPNRTIILNDNLTIYPIYEISSESTISVKVGSFSGLVYKNSSIMNRISDGVKVNNFYLNGNNITPYVFQLVNSIYDSNDYVYCYVIYFNTSGSYSIVYN